MADRLDQITEGVARLRLTMIDPHRWCFRMTSSAPTTAAPSPIETTSGANP